MFRVDYASKYSYRVNYVRPSPIRTLVSKISEISAARRVISFAAGEPDPSVIPRGLYARILAEVLEEEEKSCNYSPTEGIPSLRRAIASFMEDYEGVKSVEDDIIVTVGGSQAIDLLGKIFIDPGDHVIVENPSYVNTIVNWEFYGARLVGVSVESDGLNVDRLELVVKSLLSEGRRVKLVYTIPTGHNPAGVVMSDEKRRHLIEVASRYDLIVVEDGAYNHLVYEGSFKPLSYYDKEGRVVYVGSFSKVLGTGLRIGWIRARRELLEVLKTIKGPSDMCAPVPIQHLVERILRKRLFDEIKRKAVEEYRRKRDAMIEALDEYVQGIAYNKPFGGMFVLVRLPPSLDSEEFANMLLEKYSVAVIPGKPFYLDDSGKNTIRLNFTMVSLGEITEGVKKIGLAVRMLS
uniref:PLP-dependent aminotransferase family protein n=1 Tax=Thermogladius calderae TaxID=1200300 RepID=A0A7J3XXM3_9CREN